MGALILLLQLVTADAATPAPDVWRVTPDAAHADGVLVVRADGSLVTVWEGHRDVGRLAVLGKRVRALDDGLGLAGRNLAVLGVLGVSLGVFFGGVSTLAVGLVMVGVLFSPLYARAERTSYEFLFAQSPGIVLAGVVGAVTGLAAATGILLLLVFNRTRGLPPPDPRLLRHLGNATLWDPAQAERIVLLHNRNLPLPTTSAPASAQPAPASTNGPP